MPPEPLQELLRGDTPLSKHFLKHIRIFNNAFAFASFGTSTNQANIPQPRGRGPNTFQVKGSIYHRIGSLLPGPGRSPQFAQIYIHDSDETAEVGFRLDFICNSRSRGQENVSQSRKAKDKAIITTLQKLMYDYNPYARIFKSAGERLRADGGPVLGLRLICQRTNDSRIYNLPTADEVAAIIPGDGSNAPQDRDVVVQLFDNSFERVSALHPSYFPLTYPLLFLRGEDGFQLGLPHNPRHVPTIQPSIIVDRDMDMDMENRDDRVNKETCNNSNDANQHIDNQSEGEEDSENGDEENQIGHNPRRKNITHKEFFAYRLQYRISDNSEWILRSRRLLQQLMVDMFTTMDMNRLNYFRSNQKTIRAELYSGRHGFGTKIKIFKCCDH